MSESQSVEHEIAELETYGERFLEAARTIEYACKHIEQALSTLSRGRNDFVYWTANCREEARALRLRQMVSASEEPEGSDHA